MDLLALKKQMTCVACHDDRCVGLIIGKCIGKCPFYRNPAQHAAAMKRVYARLRKLKEPQQIRISEKYYKGLMPWAVSDGRI